MCSFQLFMEVHGNMNNKIKCDQIKEFFSVQKTEFINEQKLNSEIINSSASSFLHALSAPVIHDSLICACFGSIEI